MKTNDAYQSIDPGYDFLLLFGGLSLALHLQPPILSK